MNKNYEWFKDLSPKEIKRLAELQGLEVKTSMTRKTIARLLDKLKEERLPYRYEFLQWTQENLDKHPDAFQFGGHLVRVVRK